MLNFGIHKYFPNLNYSVYVSDLSFFKKLKLKQPCKALLLLVSPMEGGCVIAVSHAWCILAPETCAHTLGKDAYLRIHVYFLGAICFAPEVCNTAR